jgi:hypothetical protein
MAQDLQGLEAAVDVYRAEDVCGILSNYLEWVFLRSTNDSVEQELTTIQRIEGTTIATIDSLSPFPPSTLYLKFRLKLLHF